MRTKVFRNRVFLALLLGVWLLSADASAQCAMCRAVIESSGETKQAEAVNDGIVYLMMLPYIVVGIAGYAVYRSFRKKPSES